MPKNIDIKRVSDQRIQDFKTQNKPLLEVRVSPPKTNNEKTRYLSKRTNKISQFNKEKRSMDMKIVAERLDSSLS